MTSRLRSGACSSTSARAAVSSCAASPESTSRVIAAGPVGPWQTAHTCIKMGCTPAAKLGGAGRAAAPAADGGGAAAGAGAASGAGAALGSAGAAAADPVGSGGPLRARRAGGGDGRRLRRGRAPWRRAPRGRGLRHRLGRRSRRAVEARAAADPGEDACVRGGGRRPERAPAVGDRARGLREQHARLRVVGVDEADDGPVVRGRVAGEQEVRGRRGGAGRMTDLAGRHHERVDGAPERGRGGRGGRRRPGCAGLLLGSPPRRARRPGGLTRRFAGRRRSFRAPLRRRRGRVLLLLLEAELAQDLAALPLLRRLRPSGLRREEAERDEQGVAPSNVHLRDSVHRQRPGSRRRFGRRGSDRRIDPCASLRG